jgi:hypothetical protein
MDFGCLFENLTPETAVLESAALAIALSKGKDDAYLNLLSGFFMLLGDSLALIVYKRDLDAEKKDASKSSKTAPNSP